MEEKQVLITGSSRGIGREAALYLAKNGFNIVLHCNKNTKMAEEVLAEIKAAGVNGRILQFNVKDREECKKILEKDIKEKLNDHALSLLGEEMPQLMVAGNRSKQAGARI